MNQTYPTGDEYPGIPTQSAIEPAVLECVQVGKTYMFGDIYAAMVAQFGLTRDFESVTFDGGTQMPPSGDNVFYKYCNNACKALVDGGWLDDGKVGRYQNKKYSITEKGLRRIRGG